MRFFSIAAVAVALLALAPIAARAASSVVGQSTGGPAGGQCPPGMPGPGQGPDAIPAPALAAGYTCEVFDAVFTSLSAKDGVNGNTLVDVNNTLKPGYDFYLWTLWNNAIWTGWGGESDPMPTSAYSLTTALGCGTGSDNTIPGICLQPPSSGTDSSTTYTMLSCVHTNPLTFAGWTGNAFTGGYYMDVNASWADNGSTKPSGTDAYPSIYTIPLEFFVGNLSTSPYYTNGANAHFSEKDLLDERFDGGTIDWIFAVGNTTPVSEYGSSMTSNQGPTYGMLVLPQGKSVGGNAGYGSIQFYANDVADSTGPLLFKPGALPIPDTSIDGSTPPAGAWSTEDTDHDCLILAGGYGAPIFVTSAKVWEAPR